LKYFKTAEPDDVPTIQLEPSLTSTVSRNRRRTAMRTVPIQLDAYHPRRQREVKAVLPDLVLTH
jgi:hypothetical protein